MRGVAVLLMIPCHTFNAFTRPELRSSHAYILSQFVGGMAAPLFLFLAGVTFALQMDKLDSTGAPPATRVKALARRGAYILFLAYVFRFTNGLSHLPNPDWSTLWKVDILNCMGVTLMVFALASLWPAASRPRAMVIAGIAIASAAPLVSGMDWTGIPWQLKEYIVPNRSRFPVFPWSAYIAFGCAAGLVLRRVDGDRLERTIQWGALTGVIIAVAAQHYSNLPYSLYPKVDFWTDSPALVFIRTGIILILAAGAWLWTDRIARPKAGWVQVSGKTSLLVYWVHVVLVYGVLWKPWGEKLDIRSATVATILVIVAMIGLSYARLWQKSWRPTQQTYRTGPQGHTREAA